MKRSMNITKNFWLAGILILGACQADDVSPSREKIEVQVSVEAPVQTRVNAKGDGFNNEDNFKFYLAGRPDGSTSVSQTEYMYVSENKSWVSSSILYWDNQKAAPFCAVSPKPEPGGYEIGTDKDTYSVKPDQSDVANYIKSDLLIARSVATKRLISIEFQHAFCRIVVKLDPILSGDGAFKATDFEHAVVTLKAKYIKGEVEYPNNQTEGFTANAITASATPADIPMYKTENTLEYAAILPEQAVSVDGKTVLITIQKVGTPENTYTYAPKPADLDPAATNALTQGRQTTITIRLRKTNVALDNAEGKIRINPWGEGPNGNGGDIILPNN